MAPIGSEPAGIPQDFNDRTQRRQAGGPKAPADREEQKNERNANERRGNFRVEQTSFALLDGESFLSTLKAC